MRRPYRRKRRQWRLLKPFTLRKRETARRPTLLIVDDDAQVLKSARHILRHDWYIMTATSANEATAILEENRFDTVLADYDMPGKNGIWLLAQVKRTSPDTRRVLFSGSRPMDLPHLVHNGVVDCFVPKPSNRDQLNESLLG